MTPRHRNIAIFGTLAAGTIIFLYYKSEKNKAEGKVLLEAINKSYTTNDQSKAGDEAIKNTEALKLDFNKMHIGNLYGSLNDPKIGPQLKSAIAKSTTNLWAAMKGAGTDMKPLVAELAKIKNKNTLAWINKNFNTQYGEGGLFGWMKKENILYNSSYGYFSDKTASPLKTVPFINGYWHPAISQYLQKLPDYK